MVMYPLSMAGETNKKEGVTSMDRLALILVIIGALNWGLVGVADFNLVSFLFGEMTTLSRLIYGLVGLAGIWAISLLFRERTTVEH